MSVTKRELMRSVPKVGQKVAVRHRSSGKETKAGMERSKDVEIRTVAGVYMEPGKVRDHIGECWEVMPNDDSHQHIAEWKTIR